MKRTLRRIKILIVGLAFVFWLIGLMIFVTRVSSFAEPQDISLLPATDALVVLTGGSERLIAGIDLLKRGKAKKLLISGVHRGVTLERISASTNIPPDLAACCIDLGFAAANTQENAEEARDWIHAQHFSSLRLVTANYHMPRSLILFHAAMPDIAISPYPVTPDSVHLDGWWQRFGTTALLISQYHKYLLVRARLELGL